MQYHGHFDYRKVIRSILLPRMSFELFLARLPFYINMICVGLFFFWQSTHRDYVSFSIAGSLDAGFFVLTAVLSWIVAFFVVLNSTTLAICSYKTSEEKRTLDIAGIFYLAVLFLLTLLMAVIEFLSTVVLPSG